MYFHVAQPDEYWQKLKEKLQEEVDEFKKSEEAEELADIVEVIHALALAKGIRFDQIEGLRRLKAKERGEFHKRYILEEVKESLSNK